MTSHSHRAPLASIGVLRLRITITALLFALCIPVQACAQEQAQSAAASQNVPNVPERGPSSAQGLPVTFGIGGGVDLAVMRGAARMVNERCPVTLGRVQGDSTLVYVQVEGHPRTSRATPGEDAELALELCQRR